MNKKRCCLLSNTFFVGLFLTNQIKHMIIFIAITTVTIIDNPIMQHLSRMLFLFSILRYFDNSIVFNI